MKKRKRDRTTHAGGGFLLTEGADGGSLPPAGVLLRFYGRVRKQKSIGVEPMLFVMLGIVGISSD